MNKVTAQRLEMVRELAVVKSSFGTNFETEWMHNDEGNRVVECAIRLLMIDTSDIQALQDAHASYLQAVMDASPIDNDDAMDALKAFEQGYREAVAA
jgi:hypothetical protein